MKLGARIRHLREQRGMTVADLARKVGCTSSFISQLERDRTNPSVATIQKIAKVLGATTSAFFDETARNGRVVRKRERRKIVFPGREITDHLITPSLSGRLQVLYSVIKPGASSKGPYRHDSDEECALLLKGKMRFWVGEEEYTLESGDSLTFESRIPHRWENIGSERAEVIWIMTPPSY